MSQSSQCQPPKMMKRAFIIGKPSAQHGRIALICLSEAFYLKLAMAGCNCVVLRLLRQLVMHTSLIVGCLSTLANPPALMMNI